MEDVTALAVAFALPLMQMATVTGLKAGLTIQHTRMAMAAAEARDTVLGNPRLSAELPDQARAAATATSAQACIRAADVLTYLGATRRIGTRILHKVAEELTNRGVPTPAGKGRWWPEQVRRVLACPT